MPSKSFSTYIPFLILKVRYPAISRVWFIIKGGYNNKFKMKPNIIIQFFFSLGNNFLCYVISISTEVKINFHGGKNQFPLVGWCSGLTSQLGLGLAEVPQLQSPEVCLFFLWWRKYQCA